VKVNLVKANHVEEKEGRFVVPVLVEAGGRMISVKIFADGRLAGEGKGNSPLTVEGTPWFGYYDVEVTLGEYQYSERIIATVAETRGMDILVNGEPFLVKGVNVHGLDGASPEKSASMLRIMRNLGFNAWRGDYPPLWQVDMAYELNSIYTVLGPFSVSSSGDIFARQAGPPLATARELSRLQVERYKNSAGVLLWNSCNEIGGENIDFLLTLEPVYKQYDPYRRPVHYANLFGQDLYQGQDAMGVNYYFTSSQTAKSRQPLIQRSIDLARSRNIPILYTEFNSYAGAVHSTGAEAMRDMFGWGIGQGMSGGFQYMKGNSTSHPGVFDAGFNTHKIYDEAIIETLADAEVTLVDIDRDKGQAILLVKNKRRFWLREVQLTLAASGIGLSPLVLEDIAPGSVQEVVIPLPRNISWPAVTLAGNLQFVTHFGFKSKIPVMLVK